MRRSPRRSWSSRPQVKKENIHLPSTTATWLLFSINRSTWHTVLTCWRQGRGGKPTKCGHILLSELIMHDALIFPCQPSRFSCQISRVLNGAFISFPRLITQFSTQQIFSHRRWDFSKIHRRVRWKIAYLAVLLVMNFIFLFWGFLKKWEAIIEAKPVMFVSC